MDLEEHPTVRRLAEEGRLRADRATAGPTGDRAALRRLAIDCGADDAGLGTLPAPASARSVTRSAATIRGPGRC